MKVPRTDVRCCPNGDPLRVLPSLCWSSTPEVKGLPPFRHADGCQRQRARRREPPQQRDHLSVPSRPDLDKGEEIGDHGQRVVRAKDALSRLPVPEMVEDRDLPGLRPCGRILKVPVEQPCVVRGHVADVVQAGEPTDHDLLGRRPEREGDLF